MITIGQIVIAVFAGALMTWSMFSKDNSVTSVVLGLIATVAVVFAVTAMTHN